MKIRIGPNKLGLLFFAFSPKATNGIVLAGLLTYSLSTAFPSLKTVAWDVKSFDELTAAGTVLDFHQIPF